MFSAGDNPANTKSKKLFLSPVWVRSRAWDKKSQSYGIKNKLRHNPIVSQQQSHCYCSVAQSCPTLRPQGLQHARPRFHHLPELTQTHVHWVRDAIQLSHPLLHPSSLALDLSQHQGLFQWVSSSHQVAKVLELQLQHQSFQWIFRTDFL